MPKWSMFSRKKKSKKALDRGEMQAGEQAAGVPAVPLGNQELNAQLQAELKAKLPHFDADETKEEAAGDAASANAAKTDAATDGGSTTTNASLAELYKALKTSKRGGFHISSGNSVHYEKITKLLEDINDNMGKDFTSKLVVNLKNISDMEERYQELIDACTVYAARNPSTDAGKARRDIVLKIQKMAGKDLIGLSAARSEFCSMPEEEQAQQSWSKIIDKARTIHLTVSDFSQMGKAAGGQASEVLKLQGAGVRVRGADGEETPLADLHFFKPEDEIDLSQTTSEAKIVNKILERFPGLSKKEKSVIRKWAIQPKVDEAGTALQVKKPTHLSKPGQMALAALEMNAKGAGTTYNCLLEPSGIADEGGKVNMTKRNVATSRMAALLGLEHLVAKSETAEIFDEATGQTICGNLMEKADGMQMRDEFNAQFGKVKKVGIAAKTSSNVQRDLLNLQVLDVLCGQMDRHLGNIMVKLDRQTSVNEKNPLTGNETITGIMGIDNDGSFGMNTDIVGMKMSERHDRRVYDPKTGKMTLPYMDKNLAGRIRDLRPEIVRFALKGLITDAEIGTALKRLELMKKAIANTEEERFLEDNQWNDETAQELFKREWEANGKMDTEWSVEAEKLAKERINHAHIPFSEKTAAQKDEYNAKKRHAKDELKEKYLEKYMTMSNYFGRMMVYSTRTVYADGDAPRLQTE